MTRLKALLLAAVAVAGLTGIMVPDAAGAATIFVVDPHPTGIKLILEHQNDVRTSDGDVLSRDDVLIRTNVDANFAAGWSTIKPDDEGRLTDIVFTPVHPDVFTGFSFTGTLAGCEGDDHAPSHGDGCDDDHGSQSTLSPQPDHEHSPPPQTIKVIVQDNQGHAPVTFTFTETITNALFQRIGVIAAMRAETIKWIEVSTTGNFQDVRQVGFSGPNSATPEPASWALMVLGLGGIGGALRSRRKTSTAKI